MMDKKGRCCGQKPIRYKKTVTLFCSRCYREYSIETGEQVESVAWKLVSGGWRQVARREQSTTVLGLSRNRSAQRRTRANTIDGEVLGLRIKFEEIKNLMDATYPDPDLIDRKLSELGREIESVEQRATRVCDVVPPLPCGQCGHVDVHGPDCPSRRQAKP